MKNVWPKLALGEALRQRECDVAVNAGEAYQFAGVYSFGRGVFRGQEKLGNQFAYQRLTRLRHGDFVYPKLMAWEGAFGIVPEVCDGCVVSPEFPVFQLNRERISPEFLNLYFQIPRVWEEVSGRSTGTNVRRRRLHPDDFLRAKIPMPAVTEQQRVVARIEELAAQVHEARTLRHQAAGEADAIVANQIKTLFEHGQQLGWKTGKLGDYVVADCYGSSEKTHDDNSGTPVLRMGNIQNGRLDTRDLKYLHLAERERPKLLLSRGDILVNRTNSAELVASRL